MIEEDKIENKEEPVEAAAEEDTKKDAVPEETTVQEEPLEEATV